MPLLPSILLAMLHALSPAPRPSVLPVPTVLRAAGSSLLHARLHDAPR
jgi:hypothetical protein